MRDTVPIPWKLAAQLVAVVFWTLIAAGFLIWAIVLAFRKEWAEATFYLVFYGILRRIAHNAVDAKAPVKEQKQP